MAEFFSFLKIMAVCGTVFFITTAVLLAMPQSKLRSVGLEMSKWTLSVGLLLLVPSPVDVLPDVVPGIGWLDDIGYLVAAGFAAKSAMGEHRRRAILEELDFEETVASTRSAASMATKGDEMEAA